MTKIETELPELTAAAALEAGLLTSQALDRLLTDAIKRRQAADALLSIASRADSVAIAPMSMKEIDAEVKAARLNQWPFLGPSAAVAFGITSLSRTTNSTAFLITLLPILEPRPGWATPPGL